MGSGKTNTSAHDRIVAGAVAAAGLPEGSGCAVEPGTQRAAQAPDARLRPATTRLCADAERDASVGWTGTGSPDRREPTTASPGARDLRKAG